MYLIAALNLVILVGIIKVFRDMRTGRYDDQQLEEQLNKRGLMMRFLGPIARRVDTPWKMYPVGFLFGLGFDTALRSPSSSWPGPWSSEASPSTPSCRCPSSSPPG